MNMRKVFAAAALTALTTAAASAQAGQVLVLLSDADRLDLRDGKVLETGFFLNELMQPVKLLLEAGHQITFATPQGLAPSVDRSSVDKAYFGNDEAVLRSHQALLEQLKLTSKTQSPVLSLARIAQIGFDRFDALYVPGGHAPMQDLLHSAAVGRLLSSFHAAAKPTALVCHGPIALLSTLPDAPAFTRGLEPGQTPAAQAQSWIYAGYRMTVISNEEEEQAKSALNGGRMKFYPQTALERAAARYSSNSAAWTPHWVADRELITGQNPASALPVAQELLRRLAAKR